MASGSVKERSERVFRSAENFCSILDFPCYIRPLLNSGAQIFLCFRETKTSFSDREYEEKHQQKAQRETKSEVGEAGENARCDGGIHPRPPHLQARRSKIEERRWPGED
jgi:hypothetical protein